MTEVKVDTGLDTAERIVMNNQLILQTIFRHLSLSDLKGARLVCSHWGVEAVKGFGKKTTIQLQSPSLAEEGGRDHLEELATFVRRHGFIHTLKISFLNYTRLNKQFGPEGEMYMEDNVTCTLCERNEMSVAPALLSYLVRTGVWVAELRLEMTLVGKRDNTLLAQFLAHVPRMKTLALDILDADSPGLTQLTTVPSSIHKLELRFIEDELSRIPPHWSGYTPAGPPTPPSFTNFMTGFDTISFLDFHGCDPQCSLEVDSEPRCYCLEAIFNLRAVNPAAFPNLKGLKQHVRASSDNNSHYNYHESKECRLLISFPKSLTYLYLQVQQCSEDALKQVEQILKRHATTLEVCDINWLPTIYWKHQIQIRLPYLPNLKILVLNVPGSVDGCWTQEMVDAFNLRSLFVEGTFTNSLPSLTSLSVYLFRDENEGIWDHIFPSVQVEEGKRQEFGQLKTLSISLFAPCGSPQLLRLQQLFPALILLRHVRRDGDVVFGCEHRREFTTSVGNLNGLKPVKEWRATVREESFMRSDYCLRMHNQMVPFLPQPCLWF